MTDKSPGRSVPRPSETELFSALVWLGVVWEWDSLGNVEMVWNGGALWVSNTETFCSKSPIFTAGSKVPSLNGLTFGGIPLFKEDSDSFRSLLLARVLALGGEILLCE